MRIKKGAMCRECAEAEDTFDPPLSTIPGKFNNERNLPYPNERTGHKKAQMGRNPIFREESGEVQHQTDP